MVHSAIQLLPIVQQHAQYQALRAAEAAATCDVLAASDAADAAEVAAAAARRQVKTRITDLALRKIECRLEGIPDGQGNLDALTRVVAALDPPAQQATAVAVQVVFRQEGRAG